jgi:hypothetical protein
MRVAAIAAPAYFRSVLGELPRGTVLTNRIARNAPLIVAFVPDLAALKRGFDSWKRSLAKDGSLWLCWRKRASGAATDLDDNVVRDYALTHGLVDVKVCAVDATWSGMKCVYRLKDR